MRQTDNIKPTESMSHNQTKGRSMSQALHRYGRHGIEGFRKRGLSSRYADSSKQPEGGSALRQHRSDRKVRVWQVAYGEVFGYQKSNQHHRQV